MNARLDVSVSPEPPEVHLDEAAHPIPYPIPPGVLGVIKALNDLDVDQIETLKILWADRRALREEVAALKRTNAALVDAVSEANVLARLDSDRAGLELRLAAAIELHEAESHRFAVQAGLDREAIKVLAARLAAEMHR